MNLGASLVGFLRHPATVLAGVVGGIVAGSFGSGLAVLLEPAANAYVTLLSMCLLPILVCALIGGVAALLREPRTRGHLPRISLLFLAGLALPALAAALASLWIDPGGSITSGASKLLGAQIVPGSEASRADVAGFFETLIPANIFAALSAGRFVSIVVFCVSTGIALGMLERPGVEVTLGMLDTLYRAFVLLFGWILVPLPLGLFCLVAANVAQVDTAVLGALAAFVVTVWVASLGLLALYLGTIAVRTGRSPLRAARELAGPLGLAFVTDNPLVALYAAIDRLDEGLGVDRNLAETVVPFGVLANQHGQILLLCTTTLFLSQVYGIPLSALVLPVLLLAGALSGAAAVGGGASLAPVLSPLLLLVGVPDAFGVVVLGTTQAVVAPICSAVTVGATCALAVLADPGAEQEAGGAGGEAMQQAGDAA